jgi:aconitate hydratase
VPLTFADQSDYEGIAQDDELRIAAARCAISEGLPLRLENLSRGTEMMLHCELSERERQVLLAGGLLNAIRDAG